MALSISRYPVYDFGQSGNSPIALQPLTKTSVNQQAITSRNFEWRGIVEQRLKDKWHVPSEETLKKSRGYVTSIDNFMRLAYGGSRMPNLDLKKVDSHILTSTTGVRNAVFGEMVWEQINNEANWFGLLPKIPWDISGWRVLTDAGATSGGGVTENATLPDTIDPTFATVSTDPKTIATTYSVSALAQALSLRNDDNIRDLFSYMRTYSAKEHIKLINRMLGAKAEDGIASNNIEAVDRALTNADEVSNVTALGTNEGDIFSLDRDSGSAWHDPYVNHNNGTARPFNLGLLDTLFQNTYPFREPSDKYVMVTGYDTFERIGQELKSQVRYKQAPEGFIRPSVNGIQSVQAGVDGGFNVAIYKGVPIVQSNDVPSDTISRVYLINLNKFAIKVLMPTMFFQAGLLTNGDPFGINRLGDEGMFVTMAELFVPQFNCHAKLRDLE